MTVNHIKDLLYVHSTVNASCNDTNYTTTVDVPVIQPNVVIEKKFNLDRLKVELKVLLTLLLQTEALQQLIILQYLITSQYSMMRFSNGVESINTCDENGLPRFNNYNVNKKILYINVGTLAPGESRNYTVRDTANKTIVGKECLNLSVVDFISMPDNDTDNDEIRYYNNTGNDTRNSRNTTIVKNCYRHICQS